MVWDGDESWGLGGMGGKSGRSGLELDDMIDDR